MRLAVLFACCALFVTHAEAQSVPCTAKTGSGIADCVERAHPEKLVAGVTLAQRQANARFLRDRIIETARCAGIDAALNCKRGNCADISVDFLAWKHDGITEGVDVIGSWDNLARVLTLGWHTYGPPNYGHPTYQAYGPVSCLGPPDPTPTPDPTPPVDLGPILSRLDALEANLADIRNHITDLRGIAQREEAARVNGDVALREDLEKIPPTIPTRCVARILGIAVSCRVEP